MKEKVKKLQRKPKAIAPRSAAVSRKAQAIYTALRDEFLSDAKQYWIIEDDIMIRTGEPIIEDDLMIKLLSPLTIKDVVLPKTGFFVLEDHIMMRTSNLGTTFTLPVLSAVQKEGDQPLAIIGHYPRTFTGEHALICLIQASRSKEGTWTNIHLVDHKGGTIREDILRSAEFSGTAGEMKASFQGKMSSIWDFQTVYALLEKGMLDALRDYQTNN